MSTGGRVRNLRIKATIQLFGALLEIGIAATVAIRAMAITSVRIGGATINGSINAKDVTADILPPPPNVIEAYLEASLALNSTKPTADVRPRTKEPRSQNDERRDYWKASNVDRAIKD